MKKIIILAIMVLLGLNLAALTIYSPKAPPAIPLVKAAENLKNINIVYYTDVSTEILPRIIKKEEALYIIPANIAAKLYNKGQDIILAGVVSNGLLSIVSSDDTVKELKDINGKQIYIGEQGSSPDVIAKHIFMKNNIKPDIVYGASPEIAKFIIAGKAKIAVLPEPIASMTIISGKNVKRLAELSKEWSKVEGVRGIPQVGIALSEAYYNKNKDDIKKLFAEYDKAADWVITNPKEASLLGSKAGIELPAKVVETSIPLMNIMYKSGKEMKNELKKYFEKLNDYDNTAIGGKIPDERFYGE